jgi:hypothetical protein
MKNVLLILSLSIAACGRVSEKQLAPKISEARTDPKTFVAVAKDKPMFSQLSSYIDFADIRTTTAAGNVLIYMARFKDNPKKIYAVNTLGSELLYSNMMIDDKNGMIGILKNGEAIAIAFKDGVKTIRDIKGNEFENRFAKEYHGGSGFCQREKDESYGACYRAESDEFCDSFISCVALATQPSVAIVIGLACSCNA